jgi:hypothetical protein
VPLDGGRLDAVEAVAESCCCRRRGSEECHRGVRRAARVWVRVEWTEQVAGADGRRYGSPVA